MTTARDDSKARPAAADPAALDAAALLELARAERIELLPNLSRGELVAAVLAHQLGNGSTQPASGVLDLLPEGFGFLRSVHFDYEASPHDPWISPSQVRGLNLKAGQHVTGPVRAPKNNERFFALVHVDRVDGVAPGALPSRVAFAARTPVVPKRPLALGGGDAELRVLSALAPWQQGHRVLVAAPPAFARTTLLVRLAAAVRAANADAAVIVCLLDQRPEALAAARAARAAHGDGVEVVGTTFDQLPERHVALAELVLARCQRLVEAGRDVVLLFDSLTAFAHAAQRAQPASGRWLCPGLDALAVLPGKRLFAAARACAEGGSLTVIATAVHGAGVADDTLLAELRPAANSEVFVDATLAAAGVDAPFDARATRTRREEDPRDARALAAVAALREQLAAAGADPAARARVLASLPSP